MIQFYEMRTTELGKCRRYQLRGRQTYVTIDCEEKECEKDEFLAFWEKERGETYEKKVYWEEVWDIYYNKVRHNNVA